MKAASCVPGGAEGLAVVSTTGISPTMVTGLMTVAALMGPVVFQNSTRSWAERVAEAARVMRAS
ncbi:MAG: hypothetical protein KatS3mg064_1817 [Tepidiforma sp.]|nr:MAG: hypothetical protein KatS3mg064_1817 [Tepidiforma sp.]